MCYRCDYKGNSYSDLIHHLVEVHPSQHLKYREFEIDTDSGKKGYRTKEYMNIVPDEGEVLVTSDNKVGIYKGMDRQKKSKMNTPMKITEKGNSKDDDTLMANISCNPEDEEIDSLLKEMEMEHISEHQEEEDRLIRNIPSVLQNLKESGNLKSFEKFCELIAKNEFPMQNIGFLLFLDIVDWYSNQSTSEMRYVRQDTREFWEVGYRLFKGKFIRFMSGPRSSGNIVKEKEERGQCSSSDSRINFAVPSLQSLSKQKLEPIMPGIIESSISNLSDCLESPTIKICVDGKRIARGKGRKVGVIDCWGFEQSPTLAVKNERLENEQSEIKKAKTLIEDFIEKDHEYIPEESTLTVLLMLQTIVLIISNRLKDLRNIVVSLKLGIQKFMKIGDQTAKHWTTSKYAPVISGFKVNIYDADQAIDSSLRIINELSHCCSKLNGCAHKYSKNTVVNVTKHTNYHQLKSSIPGGDPSTTKQKSDDWFNLRKNACVTGSTANRAIGLGKLKEMQAHYDKVKTGKDTSQFNEIQQRNMQYGSEHEIDGIATVAARVIPALFPSVEYFEEGCKAVSDGTNDHFMIVSPDGSLREPTTNHIIMMYENKCKIENDYSTPVYYEIPKYYIPQLLCERSAYACHELLFTCWSKNSTTVFKVLFDEELWTSMWDHLILCYGGQQCKRPSKFPENKKVLEEMIESFRKQNVKFIGEFPSCSVESNPQDVKYEGGSGHTFNSNTIIEHQEIRCVEVLKPIHELSKVIDDIYKLSRTSASEILVFMASDLNRSYNEELNNAHPIAYALKGASMTNEVFTNMMQHVVEKCIEHGLKVVATSSDGQWHKYGVRDKDGRPLTVHQLQRDVWSKNISKQKQELLKHFRSLCKVNANYDNVTVNRDDNGHAILSHTTDKPITIFKNKNLKWSTDTSTDSPIDTEDFECCENDKNTSHPMVSTVEAFATDVEIDDDMVLALDRETEPCVTRDIDAATTDYLSMLFEDDSSFDQNQQNDTSSFNNLDGMFSSLVLTTDIDNATHNNDLQTDLEVATHNKDNAACSKEDTCTGLEPVTHKKDNETYSDDMFTVMGSAFSTLYGDVYSDTLFENNLVVESTVTQYQDVHYGMEMDSSVVEIVILNACRKKELG